MDDALSRSDGTFGMTKPELISGQNPLGRDLEDPNGKDDFVFTELVLAKDRERSYNYFEGCHSQLVITSHEDRSRCYSRTIADIWFKPIKTGRWETVCGQLCGRSLGNGWLYGGDVSRRRCLA